MTWWRTGLKRLKRSLGIDEDLQALRARRAAIQQDMERELDRVTAILDEADARHAEHDR